MELFVKEASCGGAIPTDPGQFKGLNPYRACCEFKKCCKKYKKGDRCKKCPKRK